MHQPCMIVFHIMSLSSLFFPHKTKSGPSLANLLRIMLPNIYCMPPVPVCASPSNIILTS